MHLIRILKYIKYINYKNQMYGSCDQKISFETCLCM